MSGKRRPIVAYYKNEDGAIVPASDGLATYEDFKKWVFEEGQADVKYFPLRQVGDEKMLATQTKLV